MLNFLVGTILWINVATAQTQAEFTWVNLTNATTTKIAELTYFPTKTLYKLAKCESSFNPLAWHKNDGRKGESSMGILQFKLKTWHYWLNYYGLPKNWNIMNPAHQIDLAERIIGDGQGPKLWANCYRKLRLAK